MPVHIASSSSILMQDDIISKCLSMQIYFELLYQSARGWLFYKFVKFIQVTVWENEIVRAIGPVDWPFVGVLLCETMKKCVS